MGRLNRETGEIHAKIVYWGAAGSGKTANAQFIYRKLKKEHRGELRVAHARKQKGGAYEFLPVQLGTVRGFQTSIHIHTVPGADRYAEERRGVLEGVDGVVFVADLRPERHEASVASLDELQQHLESYGRSLDDVLLAIQYNRRDQADENALDALHRRLKVKPEAAFEAIASEGTGVLQCLTTLSKGILSKIRREADEADAAPPKPRPARKPAPPAPKESEDADARDRTQYFESSTAEVSAELETVSQAGFRLESSGPVESRRRELTIPIRLVEEDGGRKIELALRVTLDA